MTLQLQDPTMLPSFFKILLDPSRPHLPLPPDFVSKYLKNKIPENPILQSVSGGHSWRLKIKIVDEKYSFADGWNKFVKDTQLVYGDFLVFWLVDQSTFKVVAYGQNGCQKFFPTSIKVEHENFNNGDNSLVVVVEHQDDCVEEIRIRSRGRPPKRKRAATIVPAIEGVAVMTPRGRPPNRKRVVNKVLETEIKKRSLGRPRVVVVEKNDGVKVLKKSKRKEKSVAIVSTPEVMKRPRGRPPVVKVVEKDKVLKRSKVKDKPVAKISKPEVMKKPRGRPPRVKVVGKDEGVKVVNISKVKEKGVGITSTFEAIKRPRGRPPLVKVVRRDGGVKVKRSKMKEKRVGKIPTAEVMKRPLGRPPRVKVVGKDQGVDVVKILKRKKKIPTVEVAKRPRGRPPRLNVV